MRVPRLSVRPLGWLAAIAAVALLASPGLGFAKGHANSRGVRIVLPKAGDLTVAVLTKRGRKGKLTIKNRAALPRTLTILAAKGRGKDAGKTVLVFLNRAATAARLARRSDSRSVTTAGASTDYAELDPALKAVVERNIRSLNDRLHVCVNRFGHPIDAGDLWDSLLSHELITIARASALGQAATNSACGKETPSQTLELDNFLKAFPTSGPNPTPGPTPGPTMPPAFAPSGSWSIFAGDPTDMTINVSANAPFNAFNVILGDGTHHFAGPTAGFPGFACMPIDPSTLGCKGSGTSTSGQAMTNPSPTAGMPVNGWFSTDGGQTWTKIPLPQG